MDYPNHFVPGIVFQTRFYRNTFERNLDAQQSFCSYILHRLAFFSIPTSSESRGHLERISGFPLGSKATLLALFM